MKNNSVTGGIYGLAFVGAAIYYVLHATTTSGIILGLLKALIWPALLVYRLMEFLRM